MTSIKLDNNEILFILQGIDLILSGYAEKNINDYP